MGDRDGPTGHDELAALLDGRLQAVGERAFEGRDAGRLDDADRLVPSQADGQVQFRQGHELPLRGGVELLAQLGPLHLGPKDGLALDDALALKFPGVLELLLGATDGVLGGPPQGLGPQDAVIGDGHLIGDRLEGAIGLELGDVDGELRLLETTQPTAEVEEQPLDFELRQLVARPDVEADRHGSRERIEVESRGGTLPEPDRFAPHSEGEATHIVIAGDGGQERRERDLLLASGLGNALELGAEPRLRAERQMDSLGEGQRFAGRGDGVEGGLVGFSRGGDRGRRRPVTIPPGWRPFDGWW